MMKQLFIIFFGLFLVTQAQAHGFRFEGGEGSNAQVIFEGMMAAAAKDASIVVVKGYYGSSVTKEDAVAAFRCANQSAREFSCTIAMKHDRPLDPFETYPLGAEIDPKGDVNSNAWLVSQAVLSRAMNDKTVISFKDAGQTEVSRKAQDATIKCVYKDKGDGTVMTQCHFEHE